ncbi:MAG: primosomal protein N' [Nitrospirae bacterium]|nr:primosomal protein N' [Nitrospirota bacterium]
MLAIDILFPFNLRPLTYLCPAGFQEKAAPGAFVYAPLKGTTKMGIVYGINPDFKGKTDTLKDISGICAHRSALSQEMMALIAWIARYYLAEPGLVLSFVLPRAFFTENPTPAPRRIADMPKTSFKLQKIKKEELLLATGPGDTNKAVLLHSPSYDYQLSYICKAAKSAKRSLVLCPTIEEVKYLGAVFFDTTGIRPIIIHGNLTAAQRLRACEDAGSGGKKYPIVIGTMSAALFPFIKASLIIVADEHSPYYKHEQTPRYNARDVAVMRGRIENTRVVLLSCCPSSESYFKTTTNEYTYCKASATTKRPQISVMATRSFKKLIPDRITTSIITSAQKGSKSFVYINKKGYATIICRDCGHVEMCPVCKAALAFHEDKSMRCHRCGFSAKPPEFCPVCSGFDLREVSPGSQRLEQFIRDKTGLTLSRIDRDTAKTPAIFKRMALDVLKSDVIVGTKLSLNKIVFNKHFKILAAVNPDVYFSFPDYLSAERLYQDVLTMAEMAEKDGRLYLLTTLKEELTYKFLENYDYEGFISNELTKRKGLNYPPFWKMASIEFHYNDEKPEIKLEGRKGEVEVLGPVPSDAVIKGYSQSTHMIIKAKDTDALSGAVKKLKESMGPKIRQVRLVIDVDPV